MPNEEPKAIAKAGAKKAVKKKDPKKGLNKNGKPKFSLKRWWREMLGELRKVSWPTKKELINHTIVVALFVLTLTIVIGLIDAGMSALVKLLV